jgi:hypothetical protein
MGTSNWQNIPFCVEALMKIEPQRVLDVGVGFGRWGIIVREFCENWYGRELRKDWRIHIEGIEVFADCITDYHHSFYDKIHIADARRLLPALFEEQWDVVIFGDVIEHFPKAEALDLLTRAIESSAYVLLNVPLGSEWSQEESYGNPYERHLSEWSADDFQNRALRRQAFFRDFMERPFGSFVFSESDPKGLAYSLFSRSTAIEWQAAASGEALLSPTQQQLLAHVEYLAHELETIKNSYSWRLSQKIVLSPLGLVALRLLQATQRVWAFAIKSWANPKKLSAKKITRRDSTRQTKEPAPFSDEEKEWLERVCADKPTALAVLHPDWRGIRSATLNLFSAYRLVDDTLDEPKALHTAQLLAETGCKRVVLSGFPLSHRYLVTSLYTIAPQIKVYVLWHGSFLQSYEDYAWQGFRIIQRLCRDGLIYKWGFVKKGMAEVMAKTGLRTGFVMNYVKEIPEGPSIPLEGGPHLGIWGVEWNWRKLPYAMLASTLLMPGAKVYSSTIKNKVQEFGEIMGINWEHASEDLISQHEMSTILAKMHLNIYVTLSECTPMLPLESLAVGTPCLTGPNSHLFEDNEFLHQMLVVPYPDSSMTIAEYAQRALEKRDEIIKCYIDYAQGYNEQAKASLAEFLEM